MSERKTRNRACFTNDDCPRTQICNKTKNKNVCVDRGDAKDVHIDEVSLTKSKYQELNKIKQQLQWKNKQGSEALIKEAQGKIKRVASNIDCKFDGKTQWYQNVVAKFMTPYSTIDRLLVAHQLGTGKTRSMLEMIGNFWNDPRPIIVMVPKQSLVNNFYDELFKHPTRLRKFLYECLGNPPEPMTSDFRQKCIELLEKKGKIRNGEVFPYTGKCKNSPAAPIRCVRMTQAGSDSFKKNAIFKVSQKVSAMKKLKSESIFDSCVIMIDEGHLLVQDEAWDNAAQRKSIRSLGAALQSSKNTKLALLTATPIVNRRDDAVRLMKIVQAKDTEEFLPGYVSWFMSRVGSVFATTDPEGVLPHIIEVPLLGENLEDYKKRVLEVQKGKKRTNGLYTAEHMAAAQAHRYKSLLQMNKPDHEISTKLSKIASDVKKSGKKTCVMIHKSNGLYLLEELMKRQGISVVSCAAASAAENSKKVGEKNRLNIKKFNELSNKRGEEIQCIILDSAEFSEGVSLQNVRQIILADLGEGLKEPSWGRVKQRIGRALRFCSHSRLPEDERTLEVYLYISTFDDIVVPEKEKKALEKKAREEFEKMANGEKGFEDQINQLTELKVANELAEKYRWETLDQRKYDRLRMQVREVEMANCELAQTALDKGVYGDVGCAYIPVEK